MKDAILKFFLRMITRNPVYCQVIQAVCVAVGGAAVLMKYLADQHVNLPAGLQVLSTGIASAAVAGAWVLAQLPNHPAEGNAIGNETEGGTTK